MESEAGFIESIARIILLSVVFLCAFIVVIRRVQHRLVAPSGWVLCGGILFSVVLGTEYLVFQLPAQMELDRLANVLTIHHFYGAIAGSIFVLTQLMAVYRLCQGDSRYFAWLMPALAYLTVIGLVGAFLFDLHIMFVADTLRAAAIGIAVIWYERTQKLSQPLMK